MEGGDYAIRMRRSLKYEAVLKGDMDFLEILQDQDNNNSESDYVIRGL